MLKKALVAGVVVVVSLLTINYVFPNACSHARLWLKHRRERAQASVPLEQEIDRLKMEVQRLEEEDDRHFDAVAKQVVEVKKLQREIGSHRARLNKDLDLLRARKASLVAAGEDRLVSYEGQKIDREQFVDAFDALATRYDIEEAELKSQEEELAHRQEKLEESRKKLAELKLARQKLKTRIVALEKRLANAERRQAADAGTIDDANYVKVAKDLENVEDRIAVKEEKQKLKNEDNAVSTAEKRKQTSTRKEKHLNDPKFDKKSDVSKSAAVER